MSQDCILGGVAGIITALAGILGSAALVIGSWAKLLKERGIARRRDVYLYAKVKSLMPRSKTGMFGRTSNFGYDDPTEYLDNLAREEGWKK